MDRWGAAEALLLEGFRFDRRGGGCLYRLNGAGAAEPVALGPRTLSLLGFLVERPGELVSREAIIEAVWPGRVVEEANLNVQIAKLRGILDHNREQGSCIQTMRGWGYRFVAAVRRPQGRFSESLTTLRRAPRRQRNRCCRSPTSPRLQCSPSRT
jgi:DNA-binding winged helix-turn-helix (wHTH) protein